MYTLRIRYCSYSIISIDFGKNNQGTETQQENQDIRQYNTNYSENNHQNKLN